MDSLTKQQIDYLEEMIQRRMENTGESRDESCEHITNYLKGLINYGTYL